MILLIILATLGVCKANFINLSDSAPYNCTHCQPEQIHIAFGETIKDIVVTWTTFNDTEESRVQYGVGGMAQEAKGWRVQFHDGRDQWIHRVTLKDLRPETRYVYHCGSVFGWSERFSFRTPPAGDKWVVRAAIYGDMGVQNAHSLSYLQDEAERDRFDMILHVGDFAYDMHEQQSRVGDQFMRQIQPLAAIVPYMTCPGNHEENRNFSNYKARFSMPGPDASMFYSWDIGPIHFVAVNTEAYYFLNYGLNVLFSMYEWLRRDLETANQPENRQKRPWIIMYGHRPMYCSNEFDDCWNGFLPNRVGLPLVGLGKSNSLYRNKRPWIIMYGHRPMYCSNNDDIDCSVEYTRKGLPFLGVYSLEPLLKEFGVDLVIWAHEHSYERTWPLYDEKVYNGSYEHPYVNPRAPVHIVTGSAGCREVPDGFVTKPPAWSAFRSSDYGYTRFAAHNNTHIYMEQVSVDLKGKVIDSFWLMKERHGPYNL